MRAECTSVLLSTSPVEIPQQGTAESFEAGKGLTFHCWRDPQGRHGEECRQPRSGDQP